MKLRTFAGPRWTRGRESTVSEDTIEILLICGSLRHGSTNAAVVATAGALEVEGVHASVYDEMGTLPLFNPDDDPMDGHPPEPVARLRGRLAKADAVMFSTPEYAGALPGPLVNLLDWTVGGGETYGMPVGFINAAGAASPSGGESAHTSLRTILGYTGSELVPGACLRMPLSRSDVGSAGLITDSAAHARIADALRALADRARNGESSTAKTSSA